MPTSKTQLSTNNNLLDKDTFKSLLPKTLKGSVSDELLDEINNTFSDPHMAEIYKDNILGYTQVLAEGTFKVKQYVDAVRYVSFRMMGCKKEDAYIKTFPDRYKAKVAKGISPKDISSMMSAYARTKLVNLIYKQALIPVSLINADLMQEAINTQASIMRDPRASFKVRSDAANSLMTHLKPPEEAKLELDVKIKESDTMNELREVTLELAKTQLRKAQEKDITPQMIAKQTIIKKE